MNDTMSEALKEAYALAPSNVAVIETLAISHPSLPNGTIYLCRNMEDLVCTLEDSTQHTFTAVAFNIQLPKSGDGGLELLQIQIDDVQGVVSSFLRSVAYQVDPVVIQYRPYLATDLTTPQLNPPLTLWLSSSTQDDNSVTIQANFADLINRPFPNEYYTLQRFPGLSGSQ